MKSILIFIFSLVSFFWTVPVWASPQMIYIRLENPDSPTNKDKFNISFTTLDILNRALTVKCFKINPDNSHVQIGADIAVKTGGNSGECSLENSPLTENNKTYYFYATVTAEGDPTIFTSDSVPVDFNTSGPGTPNDYKKEEEGDCRYKISFKASNDGKTTNIRIYRSDLTKFIADDGSKVGQVGISPDQVGSFTDVNLPDCNKTYYYVIRAFDDYGNGSGLAGDSITVFTTNTITSSTTTGSGAIPILDGDIPAEDQAGESEEGTPTGEEESSTGNGTVLGSENAEPQNIFNQLQSLVSRHKFSSALVAGILLIIIGYGIKKILKTGY